MDNLSSIPLTTIDGAKTSLADFSGKVLLIVNVASQCGLTPQYTALEQLYQRFKDKGFVVLGFPANDFAAQEPGTDRDIAKFCTTEYPVTFPLFSKISVKGPAIHPLYRELTSAATNHISNDPGFRDGIASYLKTKSLPAPEPTPSVLWNFEKFLVSRDGTVIARFAPDMPPEDSRIVSAIEAALA
jgi:glutathione peroxidase